MQVNERGRRKVRIGKVTSDKMDKTIVVLVESLSQHPLYNKIVKQTKKFKAHDEKNQAHIGDTVEIVESKPISAQKRWRLLKIVEKAK